MGLECGTAWMEFQWVYVRGKLMPFELPAGLQQWTLAASAAILTVIAATVIRTLVQLASRRGRWSFIAQIRPFLTYLISIFGFRAFIDAVPLDSKVIHWLDDGAYILVVVTLLALTRHLVLVAIEWSASKSGPSLTLQQGFLPLFRNIVTLFAFMIGGIMVLKHFNYDVMSLVTALGVSSLAVGLAAKDTLSNMISGFTLIIDRNLTPGDRINLAGSIGEVEEIGLRSTRIRTGDGNTLIVPNAELVNTKILNLSAPTLSTVCSATIRVPYTVPFERIRALCLETVGQIEKASKDKGRWVNLINLSEGHQVIQTGFWVNHMDDQGAAQSDFNQRILERLRAEQIPLLSPAPPISFELPSAR